MKKYTKEICAVIMVGGKSSRMGGGIKSLMKFNNKIIFERIYENLRSQTSNIIINSNIGIKYFKSYKLPIVKDKITGYQGPLAGIHAALDWAINNMGNVKWIISIPGDTPFIPKNLVERLYYKAVKNNKQIIIAKSNNKIHPVIGIWNIKLINDLEKKLLEGERKIIFWAKNHNLDYEEFSFDDYDPFFNINYLKDLEQAKKIENKFIY